MRDLHYVYVTNAFNTVEVLVAFSGKNIYCKTSYISVAEGTWSKRFVINWSSSSVFGVETNFSLKKICEDLFMASIA